jgi:starch synthase
MSRILMATSEAAPFSKTGGLADVLGSLPQALARAGEDVAVIVPLYLQSLPFLESARAVWQDLKIWLGSNPYDIQIYAADSGGVPYYLVRCPSLYEREHLYGPPGSDYPDNHIRYAVFCRTVLECMRRIWRPRIVHCHDWQTALVPVLMRAQYALDPTFYGIRTLFTIHNLGFQGIFPPTAIQEMGLDARLFTVELLEYWGKVNLMKGALVTSDKISTVSPTYAREIQTPEFGFGLDGVLRMRSRDLHGILNGVDYQRWSPEMDPLIPARYSVNDLSGKRLCKQALLQEFNLAGELDEPLAGSVSRLTTQKGFDLLCEALPELVRRGLRYVVLGTGEPQFEERLRALAAAHPQQIGVRIAYDDGLAHRIEAGADMFLMPSRYEPCGLNQIYSLRYGTIPIVRATGGLDDTIDAETGFRFREYSVTALLAAVEEAMAAWKQPQRWLQMMRAAMARDFSWDASAQQYQRLYQMMAASESAYWVAASH